MELIDKDRNENFSIEDAVHRAADYYRYSDNDNPSFRLDLILLLVEISKSLKHIAYNSQF